MGRFKIFEVFGCDSTNIPEIPPEAAACEPTAILSSEEVGWVLGRALHSANRHNSESKIKEFLFLAGLRKKEKTLVRLHKRLIWALLDFADTREALVFTVFDENDNPFSLKISLSACNMLIPAILEHVERK